MALDLQALKKGGEAFYKIVEESFELERSGKKLIKLHIGSTGLAVPSPAIKFLHTTAEGMLAPYGPGSGLAEFKNIAAEREGVKPENIVVGPGSKFLIFSLLLALKETCSELVITAPFWPAYLLIADTLGVKTRIVETTLENNWALPELELKENSVVMLCNPLNPTSSVYDFDGLKKVQAEARKTNSVLVLDEAYRDLAFEPIPFMEAVRIRSFSKEFNLEGWRLGYAVLPADLAKRLTSLVHLTTSCVSSLIQRAGIACLEKRDEILPVHVGIWKERLGALSEALREKGFRFSEPKAGMYVFVTHDRIEDGSAFARRAMSLGVVVAPGSAFGPYDRFVRISASGDSAELVRAVGILGEALS